MDPRQFQILVLRPTLERIDLWSEAAEALLLGTALHESGGLRFLKQRPNGPALGPFQMEPATLDDLYDNFLVFRPELKDMLDEFVVPAETARSRNLITSLGYACAAARLQYWRAPAALPGADDLTGLAAYWKRWWNTPAGAGRPEQFIEAWHRYMP